MDKVIESSSKGPTKRRKSIPPLGQEARENFLINLAYQAAEKKLKDGTASSQIITTLLNLGTQKTQLENEKLRSDLRVAAAKIETMESQRSSTELMEQALEAFKRYSGNNYDDEDEDDYDE